MRGGWENLRFPADTALAEQDRSHPLVSTSKTPVVWRPMATDFVLLGFQTCTAVVCVSWTFLL